MFKQIARQIIISLLTLEARSVLFKYKPKIVAVTGSVGKTSTKDAIYSVLSGSVYTGKSSKSFNSEIGLPLAILIGSKSGWNNPLKWLKTLFNGVVLVVFKSHYPNWLVLEAGVDRPGDMDSTISLIKPNIAVVTNLPDTPAHVEYFDSASAVYDEKWKLVGALRAGGTLIANGDDKNIRSRIEKVSDKNILTYGFGETAMVRGAHIQTTYKEYDGIEFPSGITFKLEYKENSVPVQIEGTLGEGHILSALAAASVGISLEINSIKIAHGIQEGDTPPGRLKLLKGINNSLIIDDTYNSSPGAAILALNILSGTRCSGKKIVVLGDMLELGEKTVPEHIEAGKNIPEDVKLIYAVGHRARHIGEGAIQAGHKKGDMKFYEHAEQAARNIIKRIEPGDIVLVKGSQFMRLEKLVAEIMEEKESKERLLVRQDKAWSKR